MKLKSNKSSERRLTILTLSEQKSIYGFPRFDNQERKHYFTINKIEKDILDTQFRGFTSKLYFLLQLGYFKATYQFFHFKHQDIPEDTYYIVKKHFSQLPKERFKGIYTKKLRQNHAAQILKLLSYRLASKNDRKDMLEKAKSIVFIDANPKYIFKELLRFSREKKFVLPSYTSMQDMISKAIFEQEKKIIQKLRSLLSKDIKAELDTLLHKESETRYQLTLIKRPIQNFSNKQATVERKKRDDLERLFEAARLVFQEIKMSHLSIKYFAQLVDRYTIQQLKQFHDIKRYFYILCFVYYKYLKINDDLVKTFLHFVSKYKGEVKIAVKTET